MEPYKKQFTWPNLSDSLIHHVLSMFVTFKNLFMGLNKHLKLGTLNSAINW
jgi:hypothetical protein